MSMPRRCVVLVLALIIVNLQIFDLLPSRMITDAVPVRSVRRRQLQQQTSARDQLPVSIILKIFTSAEERTLCFYLCLFVCLSVCLLDYSKSYELSLMKCFGALGRSLRKNRLDFGGDTDNDQIQDF